MAEVTAMRNNALPYPIYGQPFTIVFPFLDADGDLVTAATTPDAERSLNGDTFADCTNESTEIATGSGIYYLTLTAAEMTADVVSVIAKSATAGMKTTVAVLYPRKLVTVHSGTAADDGSGTGDIVLDSGASAVDDFYNGMVCIAVIDSNTEIRIIDDYVGSTKTASVTPDWNVAVDVNDTFTIVLPEGFASYVHPVKIYSDTTIIYSDTTRIESDTTRIESDTTQIQSDTARIESDTTQIQSDTARIESDTTHIESDVISNATRATTIASNVLIVKSDTSDIRSNLAGLVGAAGILSDINSGIDVIQTTVSDIQSDTNDMQPVVTLIRLGTLIIEEKMEGLVPAYGTIGATGNSTTAVHLPGTTLDTLSDDELNGYQLVLYDVSTDEYHTRTILDWTDVGDLATVATLPFTPQASTDLYWVMPPSSGQTPELGGTVSDVLSRLTLVHSETTAIQGIVSDVQSDTNKLVSDLTEVDTSDIMSMLTLIRSDTTTLASDLAEGDFSDILSRLTVTNSQVLIIKSDTSDVKSLMAVWAGAGGILSDIGSGVDALQSGGLLTVAQDSKLTEINSQVVRIHSDTITLASDLAEADFSDILSRLTLIHSETTAIQGIVSDIQSDTSDIQSKLVVAQATLSDIQSDTNVMVPIVSDIQSDTNKLVSDATEVDASDILSLLTLVRSDTAVIEAAVSDIQSDTNVLITKMRGVVLATGTIGATGNSTTVVHIPDTALDSLSNDEIKNYNVIIYDVSLDEYHARTITTWTDVGDLATVTPALPFTPEASVDLYWVLPPWANQFDYDHSDIVSLLTLIRSDTTHIESDAVAIETIVSDVQSDTNKLVSDATEVDTSDIMSMLTLIRSDTTTLASDLAEGDFSDILSRLTVTNSNILIIKSDTSDIRSALVISVSDTTAIHTLATKIDSDQASQFAIIEPYVSDIYSDTTAIEIATAAGALTAAQDSKLTEINSQVVRIHSDTITLASDLAEGDFSDILSRLTVTNSQLLIVKSDTSDIRSNLAGLVGAAGLLSDIASGVDVIQSVTSDIQSDTSDIQSKLVVAQATLSDIQSDTNVMVPIISDIQSDTAVLITKMRALVLANGTIGATGNTTTVIHIPDTVLDSLSDDEINGYGVVIYDVSLDEYHVRTIIDWTNTGDLATVSTLPFTPEASVDLYWILPPYAQQFEYDHSDIISLLTLVRSDTTQIETVTSDIQSDTNKLVSDATEVDTSDIMSMLTLIRSDTTTLASDLAEGDFSDILSRLTVTNSNVLIIKSDTSDIRSNLAGLVGAAGLLSDIASGVDVIQSVTSDIQSDTSDIQSKLVVAQATLSDIQSDTNVMVPIISDIQSDTSDIQSKLVALTAVASDIQSDTNKLVSDATEVDTSDIQSLLTKVYSDTNAITDKLTGFTWYYGTIGATGNDTTHVHISSAADEDDELLNRKLIIYDVSAATFYQRFVAGYSGATKLATLDEALPVTPEASVDLFWVLAFDELSVTAEATALNSDQDSKLTRIANAIVEVDTSDIHSLLTKVYSDTTVIEPIVSDIQSDTSDIQSKLVALAAIASDIQSDTNKLVSDATEVDASDILSLLTLVRSDTAHIESNAVRILSDTNTLASDLLEGDFSDILSRLTVTNSQVLIIKSDTSDIRSNLAGLVGAAGLLSDIASGVDVIQSVTSDIQSDTSDIQSKLVVAQASLSDIQSDTNKLISDATEVDASDILSLLTLVRSDTAHIESNAVRILSDTITLASDLAEGDFSDILSRLTVTNSNVLIIKSDTSDIRSALVIVASDTAAIEAAGGSLSVAQDSKLTQIHSDQSSQFVVIENFVSDIYSDTTALADSVWDEAVEGAYSARELMRLYAAALGGKASGLETGTPKYRDSADSKNRIDATTDENGNRTAVTLDLT
jgi:DNA-binding TFAR19-related protein (PDSD5 family)